ncbi:hypothetical protein DEAC_c31260 [Desulfosporosinus acididurans]|uniref:Wadjet protein JetD C-terminal domain-containing protein n=1 Tax=Desulfosporosinus acididurans TaxID=476652 RepID=A0A0J1FPA2_9FIRM|nr:hypothetical protein [Desulfosporosinus acididurans]KLU64798.1 hypothetical protein DEAC_c31260 [Desulfosporosinus acididurans]
MELLEKIFLHSKQTISDQELQRIAQESDYELFHTQVEKFVESGVLVAVKSSKTNGRIPPLFNRYRIIKPQEDFSAYLESVRRLNPLLNIAGYLQRPELYKKHLEIVEGLSRYLWFARELLEQPMSRKERSFSVWGREKLLDEHLALVKEVLKFNRLEETFLNFYDTPEPFFEYHHQPGELTTVLVIENKDTWFTLRKLMQTSGKSNIAGTEVNVLLYGEGNKITKKGALEEYKVTMLGGQKKKISAGISAAKPTTEGASCDECAKDGVSIRPAISVEADKKGNSCEGSALVVGQCQPRFLYFGDLDWEGIRLFFRTRDANPSLDIKPFSYLYRLMLELAESVELPRSLDQRGVSGPLSEFLSLIGLTEESSLSSILAEGRYIPQEIVNYQVAAKILK